MNKVKPYKVKAVADELLEGKTYSEALRNNNYGKGAIHNGVKNKVIQEALILNSMAFSKQGITAEDITRELKYIYEDAKANYENTKAKDLKLKWNDKMQTASQTLAKHILPTTLHLKDTTPDKHKTYRTLEDIFTDSTHRQ